VVKGGSRNVGGVRRCGVRWCAALDGEQRYQTLNLFKFLMG
jgi:hypothetical protein